MKIHTESGSTYSIVDGFCVKTDRDGNRVDSFKVWGMKSIPRHDITWEELAEIPQGEPVIGDRLYISGKDVWWVTTRVVEVEQ